MAFSREGQTDPARTRKLRFWFSSETVRSSTGFFAVEIIFETSTRLAYRPKQLGAVDESQGGGRISQVG